MSRPSRLRIRHNLLLLVAAFAICGLLAGCGLLTGPSKTSSRNAGGGIEQASTVAPPTIDVVFLVDQSGSMKTTDPSNIRFDAVRYAIDNIRLKGTSQKPHRVGLVQFGAGAPAEISSELVETSNATGLAKISSLLGPRDLSWTSFTSALERAQSILENGGAFSPNHRPAIVIFTDGTPEDGRKLSHTAYFKEIEDFYKSRLATRGCSLYLVALDPSGSYWSKDEPYWKQLTSDRAYSISSVQDLKEKFNLIVLDILQLPKLAKDDLSPGKTDFRVGPYLEQVEFHTFGSAPTALTLVDPSGNNVEPRVWKSPDYTILSIPKPQQGKWGYVLAAGDSGLTVYRNEVPVRPQLVIPRPTHAAGKPIRIVARVQYVDGSPLTELPDYPIRITARIVQGNESPQHLTLTSVGSGVYESASEVPSSTKPVRSNVDIVLHAGTSEEYISTNPVEIISEPYFAVSLQSGSWLRHYSDFVSVNAVLCENGQAVDSGNVFTSPNAVIRAQVSGSPSGKESSSIWLDPVPGKKGQYIGTITYPVRDQGRYTVTYALGATDARNGKRIEYQEPVSLQVVPTWLDRAIVGGEFLAIVVLAAIAVILVAILGTIIWAVRLRRMFGGSLTISYRIDTRSTPKQMHKEKKPTAKASGLQDLISSAGQTESQGSMQPAQQSSSKTVSRQYRLNKKLVYGRPGRFFFIYGGKRSHSGRRNAGIGVSADGSKQVYVIRYFQFPLLGSQRCESGRDITIGKHTLSFDKKQ